MKIKRILTGVLAGAFLTAMSAVSASAASETAVSKLGDPTGDGQVNAVDASNILSIYAGVSVEAEELSEELLAICDVNNDGSVNAVDASLVLSYYASQATDDEEKALEEFITELLGDLEDIENSWPEWVENTELSPYDPWSNPWINGEIRNNIDPETGEYTGELVPGSADPWSPWGLTSPWGSINPWAEFENEVNDIVEGREETPDTAPEAE